MTKITKELKKLVVQEALKLRKYAKKSERAKLNFWYLDSHSTLSCIYGQMTGNCHSPRAVQLLNKCTVPYSKEVFCNNKYDYYRKSDQKEFIRSDIRDFSPIEYYISLPGAKKEDLINLIKS